MAGKYFNCTIFILLAFFIFTGPFVEATEKREKDDIDLQERIEKLRTESRSAREPALQEKKLAELCAILSVSSRWKELREESAYGIKKFPTGVRYPDFSLHFVTSNIQTGSYAAAMRESDRLLESNHDAHLMHRALFLKSYLILKTRGSSKEYLGSVRQLSDGFGSSEAGPSIILMYADYYEKKQDIGRSYAAHLDLRKKYPRSLEAAASREKYEALKKKNPRAVAYIPGNEDLSAPDSFDIQPEIESVEESKGEGGYAVAIGPFAKKREAEQIRKITLQFGASRVIRLRGAYMVYAGECSDSDAALEVRVRLAEEYGINGTIVKLKNSETKQYIYGGE